jgi:SAM-dependent methyltransferase
VSWRERFPPSVPPWTQEYVDRHRELICAALDDPALLAILREGRPLPAHYGVGFDERVVELPWLLAHPLHGRLLDAGSTLNHAHVLERLLTRVERLHVVTLAPEEHAFTKLGVSYLYEDLRALPYRTSYFDAVACISTLEHVGMDNRLYGSDLPRAAEPQREAARALDELVRVLAPGGTLFLTVPYGAAEDHGWFRQYDREAVIKLGEVRRLTLEALSVFRYTAAGWQRSDLDDAAEVTYRDYQRSPVLVADQAAAARAVACMRFMRVAASPEPLLGA